MGQGLLTICIQIASDITGIDPRLIDARVDTTFALGCGQTTGSRATVFSGNAVAIAARHLRAALDAGETLDGMKGRVFEGDFYDQSTTSLDVDDPTIHLTFGFATQVAILDENGRLSKFIAAHDVGRAINPMLCAGQIEGSVHMGLGYALTEELPCPGGHPATDKLRGIGVLRAQDMPEVEVILVECPSPPARSVRAASARSASCPPPARSTARCTASTAVAHHPPHEEQPRGGRVPRETARGRRAL
jgi:CO/xanthine dehydrogenase Mo-binding subunit